MDDIWQKIYQSLLAAEKVVAATIVSHHGSTPRTSGSKMLIYNDGRTVGTIGGGTVEADVIQSARALFSSGNSVIKSYNLTNMPGVAEMDLICGGHIQVLVEYIPHNGDTIELYRRLNNTVEKGRAGLCVGRLFTTGHADSCKVKRSLQIENTSWFGSLQISFELQELLERQNHNQYTSSLLELNGRQYVTDLITPPQTVYLIGGGHVAKEIAPLAHNASFRIIIIDDRREFANIERFPYAHRVLVCTNRSDPLQAANVDENSYIVIVTRGHSFDKEALGQALRTKAGYIGMIGSRKKRDLIYQTLENEGFTTSDFERVHCPIGLPIGAETPFEIGVSIIAELIEHRSKRAKI